MLACVPQFAQFEFDLIAFDPASQRRTVGYIELARTSPGVSENCRMIEVRRTREGDPLEFEVIVRVGGGETRHHVTMARDTCGRLTAGRHTPARCIEAAFQFLLDREPKESILRHFDVTVISHYFPESASCRATSRVKRYGPLSTMVVVGTFERALVIVTMAQAISASAKTNTIAPSQPAGRSTGSNGKGASQLSVSPAVTASPHASSGRTMTCAVFAVRHPNRDYEH